MASPAADVFLSYKAEDRARLAPLVAALEAEGLTVWWDAQIGLGADWRQDIQEHLEAAKCVIVAWSKRSVGRGGRFVRDEAALAHRRGIYLPIRLDSAEPPLGFGEIQALPLKGWKGDRSDPRFVALAAAVRSRIAGEEPLFSSWHESESPVSRRRLVLAGAATLALAAGGTGYWLFRDPLPDEAKRLLGEGEAALNEGTVEQVATGVARLRQAVEVAPDRPEPWGALALAYRRQAGLSPSGQAELISSRAAHAQRRAFSLDPDNGGALAAQLGEIPVFGNWLAYEQACRRAIERQPRHASLNASLAFCLLQVGRQSDALPAIDQSISTSPGLVFAHLLKIPTLADLGRLDEAEKAMEIARGNWPRHYGVWFTCLYHLAFHGDALKALAMIDDAASRPTGIPDWNYDLTRAQIMSLQTRSPTDVAEAAEAGRSAAARGTGFAEGAVLFAGALGRVDEAYELIDAYYFDRGFTVGEQRFSKEQGMFSPRRRRNTFFLFRSLMKPVRDDRRFGTLTETLRLADYWRKSGTRPG